MGCSRTPVITKSAHLRSRDHRRQHVCLLNVDANKNVGNERHTNLITVCRITGLRVSLSERPSVCQVEAHS